MLNINQNFDLKAPVFNFDRDYFNSLEELEAYDTSNVPDHFITNVAGTLYQFTDGKWRMMINTEGDTDNTHYVNLGCDNAFVSITDGVPDALTIMDKNVCDASLCPGLLNLQNGCRNIILDAGYDGINVSGDNNSNTTITDNQIICGDDSCKVYVYGDESRIEITDEVGRYTDFGSSGVFGQNEANNKSFSLNLPGENDIDEDPSLFLQNADSSAKLTSGGLTFISSDDEFKTNIDGYCTKISDNNGNLELYSTEMAFTDNAHHSHIYIHSKNINNGTDNFITIGSDEKFKISRPADNTEGATITGVKSIAAFSNPSATKVWATDGSTVDLTTKANASDVLLKKSASGGYYIEENSNALGLNAFAANDSCTASGHYSFAEGGHIEASGSYSHAEGVSTEAIGTGSHAEGNGTKAQGNYAHAEGETTKALGNYSHAEGLGTTASDDFSHAEGGYTEAKYGSHAEGYYTHAVSNYTHAEGEYTSASGAYSHAEGFATHSNGNSSHSEGKSTNASGYCSHAEGDNTIASGYGSHAQGISNIENENAIHSVGIGNNTTRKNAEYIYAKNAENGTGLTDDPKNGYKYLIGVGGYDGISTDNTTYKSVQEVIADLTSRIEQLETKVRALEAANTPA